MVSGSAKILQRLSHQPVGEVVVLADLTSAHDLTGVIREVDQRCQAVLGAFRELQHGGWWLCANSTQKMLFHPQKFWLNFQKKIKI